MKYLNTISIIIFLALLPSYSIGFENNISKQHSLRVFTKKYIDNTLYLTLVTPEIVRVQVIPHNAQSNFPRVEIVLPQVENGSRFQVNNKNTYIELNSGKLILQVDKHALYVDFFDARGNPLSIDASGITKIGTYLQSTRFINSSEEFFGFGLQFHSFMQRGKTKMLKTNSDPPNDSGNSHAIVPFFLSTAGYGIFLDSHGYTYFDMGSTNPNQLFFQTPDPIMDYYFCYGPSFYELLARYTDLTGKMMMPPKWGLGFWYRTKYDLNEIQVQEIASGFRDHNIPCDVIGLEPGWQTHYYPCSYVWNTTKFPNPAFFIDQLQEQGFHINLWEHAYVHSSSPIYNELKQDGVVADTTVWNGLVPDFTLSSTTEIFARMHESEHLDIGVSGFKLDECDGSDYTGNWFFPDETLFPSGLTGAQMHNVFGLLYQKSFHQMFNQRNQRTYLLCRGLFASGQRYPSVVYSDWYGFEEYVRVAANSGFSGVLWCPEVRQTEDTTEFIHRFQTVFFSPLAMINAWQDGVTPWDKGEKVETIFQTYAQLRMKLIPYIYSSFWQMHLTGIPIVRALVVDSPDDRNTYNVDNQFMFGDSLLVAPIISGNERNLYLPAGKWVDWWTGTIYQGKQTIHYHTSLDKIPLFVQAGAIIPMQNPMNYINEQSNSTLIIRIFSDNNPSEYTFYDDDGETLDYLNGQNFQVVLRCIPTSEGLILKSDKPTGKFVTTWKSIKWKVQHIEQEPPLVILNHRKLIRVRLEEIDSVQIGYTYNPVSQTLYIKTPFGKKQSINIQFNSNKPRL
jgi:alpha-D-xyloside xylohydrolase